MKKTIAAAVGIVLALGLAGCTSDDAPGKHVQKPFVNSSATSEPTDTTEPALSAPDQNVVKLFQDLNSTYVGTDAVAAYEALTASDDIGEVFIVSPETNEFLDPSALAGRTVTSIEGGTETTLLLISQ